MRNYYLPSPCFCPLFSLVEVEGIYCSIKTSLSLLSLLKIDCLFTSSPNPFTLNFVILIGVYVDECLPGIMLTTFGDRGVLDSEEKSVEIKEEKIDCRH